MDDVIQIACFAVLAFTAGRLYAMVKIARQAGIPWPILRKMAWAGIRGQLHSNVTAAYQDADGTGWGDGSMPSFFDEHE